MYQNAKQFGILFLNKKKCFFRKSVHISVFEMLQYVYLQTSQNVVCMCLYIDFYDIAVELSKLTYNVCHTTYSYNYVILFVFVLC